MRSGNNDAYPVTRSGHRDLRLRGRITVRPERFGLPTYCSGGLAAPIINTLPRFAGVEICLVDTDLRPAQTPAKQTQIGPPLGTIMSTRRTGIEGVRRSLCRWSLFALRHEQARHLVVGRVRVRPQVIGDRS